MYYVNRKNQHQRKSGNNTQKDCRRFNFHPQRRIRTRSKAKIIKQTEYHLIEARKQELERELRNL